MIANHLFDLAAMLALYALLFASYYGWGRLAVRALRYRHPSAMPFAPTIWIGWAAALFTTQAIHLFVPISGLVSIGLLAIGLAFGLPGLLSKFRADPSLRSPVSIAAALAFIAFAAWIASRSMLAPTNYDSGLYHFNAIRWINSYRIVPGLGNLHGRLAFNQSFFAYVASLNFHPPFGLSHAHGHNLANSFLFLLLTITALEQLAPAVRNPRLLATSHPLLYGPALFTLPVLGYLAIHAQHFESPSPDPAATILQLAIFLFFLRGLHDWLQGERSGYWARSVIVLAATAITLKLSNLAFSSALILICLSILARSPTQKAAQLSAALRSVLGPITPALAPAVVILGLWAVRGFILAGGPLYPSTFGHMDVDWAVPIEKVQEEARWVRSWARTPRAPWDEVLGNWDWFGPWLERNYRPRPAMSYPVAIGLLAWTLTCAWTLFLRVKRKTAPHLVEFLPVLPMAAGLPYWFFTAPDPRFAHAQFWLFAMTAMLALLAIAKQEFGPRAYVFAISAGFLVTNFFLMGSVASHARKVKEISTSGFEPVPAPAMNTKDTASGLTVHIPADGNQCWDSPIPATPYYNENLRLRGDGIESGFTVLPETEESSSGAP